jgi:hypothetical protein
VFEKKNGLWIERTFTMWIGRNFTLLRWLPLADAGERECAAASTWSSQGGADRGHLDLGLTCRFNLVLAAGKGMAPGLGRRSTSEKRSTGSKGRPASSEIPWRCWLSVLLAAGKRRGREKA